MNSESEYLAPAFKNLGAQNHLYYYTKKHCLDNWRRHVARHFCISHKADSKRDVYTDRAPHAVMGSWLAGKEVPEEWGPLETAECGSTTSQLGRQGPRMLEAEGASRQRQRTGKGTEGSGALASPAISWSFCDSDSSLPKQNCLFHRILSFLGTLNLFITTQGMMLKDTAFPSCIGCLALPHGCFPPSPLYLKHFFQL